MMKKIIYVVLLYLPLFLFSQINTDDLNLANKISLIDEENILRNSDYHNWGSSIIKGKDGKYHLFYAQMSKEIGFKSWLTDGVVSHAISDSPAGPYIHKEVVLRVVGQTFGMLIQLTIQESNFLMANITYIICLPTRTTGYFQKKSSISQEME